jgi:hypothetical protein
MRYDGQGRQNRWVFPSKTTAGAVNDSDYESYTYDVAGNRLSLRRSFPIRRSDGASLGSEKRPHVGTLLSAH